MIKAIGPMAIDKLFVFACISDQGHGTTFLNDYC